MAKSAILSVRVVSNTSEASRQLQKYTGSLRQLQKQAALPIKSKFEWQGIVKGAQLMQTQGGLVRRAWEKTFAVIKVGAAAAAAGLAALFAKGWARFTTLEGAQRAFTVMLKSAEAAKNMVAQLVEVVTGTPISVAWVTDAATRLKGMGIAARDIPGYMRAIVDSASLMGGTQEKIDQVADAFGRTQAQGKVTGETLFELSSVGIDAATILGNAFGKSTEQIRKDISKGLIPAKEGLDAIVAGIENGSKGVAGETQKLGGLAKGLGDTLQGAFNNMKTAFSAVGADLLTALSPILRSLIGEVTNFLKSFRETGNIQKTVDIIKAFAETLKTLAPALKWLLPLGAVIAGFIIGFNGFSNVILLITRVTAAFQMMSLVFAASPIGLIVAAIAALVAGFIALYTTNEPFRNFINGMMEAIGGFFASVGTVIQTTIQWIIDAWNNTVAVIQAIITGLVEFFTPAFTAIAEAWNATWNVIVAIFGPIIEAVKAIIYAFTEFFKFEINMFILVWTTVWNAIVAFFTPVIEGLKAAWNLFAAALGLAIRVFQVTFQTIWNAIVAFFTPIISKIKEIWDGFTKLLSPAIEEFQKVWERVTGAIKKVWDDVIGSLKKVWDDFWGAIGGFFNGIGDFFKGMNSNMSIDVNKNSTVTALAASPQLYAAKNPMIPRQVEIIGGTTQNVYNFTINGALDSGGVARQIEKILKNENIKKGKMRGI